MAKCRSCGEEIMWIKTKAGRSMPVNMERIWFTEGGDETFVTREGKVIRGTRTALRARPAMAGFISHFATCPNADAHRRGKNKASEGGE